MRKFVTDDKARVGDWLYSRVGRSAPFAPANAYNAIGVEDESGNLIAGVAFDSFTPNVRCSMHCAGEAENWCSRKLLQFCFEYVFNVAQCKVVINSVAAKNLASIKFTEHVGFKEIGRVFEGDGDSDLIIFALHRNNCKWIDRG